MKRLKKKMRTEKSTHPLMMSPPRPERRPSRVARLGLVSLMCTVVSASSWANELSVRVSKQGTSQLIKSAAVCLGTPADHAQFGTVLTGAGGDVRFSQVPASTPLVLTVSKAGFQGRRIVIEPYRTDRTVFLSLPAGAGGPACGRPEPVAAPVASNLLGVDEFQINDGAVETNERDVVLSYSVTGSPTHYRVSESRNFAAAAWVPFQSPVQYRLSPGAGMKTVYFQLRRTHSQTGASIQGESNVASSRIRLGG